DVQVPLEPLRLPPELVVGEIFGRVRNRGHEYSGQRSAHMRLRAIEAAGTESLRPRDVTQDLRRDVPGEIRPTLGPAPGVLEVLGIEVVLIARDAVRDGADAGVGRRGRRRASAEIIESLDFAAEAANIGSLFDGVHAVVARAAGQGERLRDDVEVEG